MHPVIGYSITTPYKKPGSMWSLGYHTGVDYACPVGTEVRAPVPGYVAKTAWDRSYGNYVLLRCHLGGIAYNVYLCHLSKFLCEAGEQVLIGQQVALSGNTGNTSGPHLHLEVRQSPYGFNRTDIVDPVVVYRYNETLAPTPQQPTPTVFDLCEWNIARERWYTPWVNRAKEIQRELSDEASVYCFQELFETKAINTVKEALPWCENFSGRAGLEFFYDIDKWSRVAAENHYSGIANRWAQEVTLKRIQTGQLVTFFNAHAPIKAEGFAAKEEYGRWLGGWVKKAVNPVVIAGDFNAPSESSPPKSNLQMLGFRSFKQQAAITNEGVKEFIPKGQDLCSIYTRPVGPADIIGGEVDVSTNSLESDHRRLEARIVVAP